MAHIHRLSVESYEKHYKTTLHADLVKQYEISDMPGLLLSPRACRVGDDFHVCTSCRWSTRLCKKTRINPPKHSIANGFVIGHIPRHPKVHYPNNHLPGQLLREDYPNGIQTVNETDIKFSDVFCAAFNSLSCRYKYVFGFTGGYEKELCGNYSISKSETADKQAPWANAAYSNSSKIKLHRQWEYYFRSKMDCERNNPCKGCPLQSLAWVVYFGI